MVRRGVGGDERAARTCPRVAQSTFAGYLFANLTEGKFRELRTDEQLLPHVVHLDINVGNGRRAEHHEIDAEVQRLVGLCATVIRNHDEAWGPWPEYHYVMADPEGHVFCVQ